MEEALKNVQLPSKPPDSGNSPRSRGRVQLAAEVRGESPAPNAFWFGSAERPLFGWYHAPSTPARAVVLLCNPIGQEALVLHRTYRRMAQHLASKGFGVLRFDYDGTGDSAGSDEDDGRVGAWLGSVGHAVQEARSRSGCTEVILIGTRLGALLATNYAAHAPVAGLVLIAPPRSGKAWLREARALQALRERNLPPVDGVKSEGEIAGFLLSEETRAALSQLDFGKLSKAPASRALVIPRDDLPGGEVELVQALRNLGTKADLNLAKGYAASVPDDPFKAVVPLELFSALATWLDENFPSAKAQTPSVTSTMVPSASAGSSTKLDATTSERVVDIAGLFGILSEPQAPNSRNNTAVILLNIGANYHIGSNRMYVHMSRAWAASGFQALRMDFSGMGDSPLGQTGKENDVYASRFMAEARLAVDYLKERGAQQIVLMGLCSGAYVAYHAATADPRVSGVVLVNPITFHWTEGDSLEVRMRKSFGSTEQYKRRLFRYDTWRRILSGKVSVAAISVELARRVWRRVSSEFRSALARLRGEIGEATDIERGFKRMSSRGTSSLLVLGAEDGSRDAVESHLGKDAEAMKLAPGFCLEIWDGADHTFTPLWSQRKLIQRITEHLQSQQAP